MKVALLSHEGGGISSVSHGLAESLAKKKIPTGIFTGTPTRGLQTEKLNEFLEVIRFPILNFPPRSVWFQVMHFNKLLDQLKKYKIIHAISPDASFLFTFCRKKLERPFVTTIHGSARAFQREFLHSPLSCWNLGDFGNHIMKFPLNDFATKRCLINSDHAVICSYTALNELRSYGTLKTEKTTVIYNGVNFGEIDDVGTDQEYGEADFSIIYAGRLVWTKGITFLLKAFKILKREMRDVNLKIFGSGPLEREIKKIILQSGLRGAVHFQSHMRHKDLMVEIKKSTVAVLPSLYEGQSMFALEAMACKKPLVVFDAPYSREIVLHMKNGVISKTYDCQDLSEKIELLLSDKKLRRKIGQNAYNYVKKEHNWDIQADKYVNVYHEIATPLNASTQKISTIA